MITTTDFKRIKALLDEAYKSLENEAVRGGINIFSKEFRNVSLRVRDSILDKAGVTLEEYNQAAVKLEEYSPEVLLGMIEDIVNKLNGIQIPSKEEIAAIAEDVASKYIVEPIYARELAFTNLPITGIFSAMFDMKLSSLAERPPDNLFGLAIYKPESFISRYLGLFGMSANHSLKFFSEAKSLNILPNAGIDCFGLVAVRSTPCLRGADMSIEVINERGIFKASTTPLHIF